MGDDADSPDQNSEFQRLASELVRAVRAAERLRGSLELVGSAEAAELLGIGTAALWERRRTKLRGEPFPQPLAELRCGPIWLRADMEEYARAYRRSRGRPHG